MVMESIITAVTMNIPSIPFPIMGKDHINMSKLKFILISMCKTAAAMPAVLASLL